MDKKAATSEPDISAKEILTNWSKADRPKLNVSDLVRPSQLCNFARLMVEKALLTSKKTCAKDSLF